MEEVIKARDRKVFRTSGLTIMSRCRCRYRLSRSVNPLNLSYEGVIGGVKMCFRVIV